MANKKPLVLGPDGRPRQAQAGDVLDAATLPNPVAAWLSFSVSGGVVTILDSRGVSGVTRLMTGVFGVSWSTAFSSNKYAVIASAGCNGVRLCADLVARSSQYAASCQIATSRVDSAGALYDPDICCLIALGA